MDVTFSIDQCTIIIKGSLNAQNAIDRQLGILFYYKGFALGDSNIRILRNRERRLHQIDLAACVVEVIFRYLLRITEEIDDSMCGNGGVRMEHSIIVDKNRGSTVGDQTSGLFLRAVYDGDIQSRGCVAFRDFPRVLQGDRQSIQIQNIGEITISSKIECAERNRNFLLGRNERGVNFIVSIVITVHIGTETLWINNVPVDNLRRRIILGNEARDIVQSGVIFGRGEDKGAGAGVFEGVIPETKVAQIIGGRSGGVDKGAAIRDSARGNRKGAVVLYGTFVGESIVAVQNTIIHYYTLRIGVIQIVRIQITIIFQCSVVIQSAALKLAFVDQCAVVGELEILDLTAVFQCATRFYGHSVVVFEASLIFKGARQSKHTIFIVSESGLGVVIITGNILDAAGADKIAIRIE